MSPKSAGAKGAVAVWRLGAVLCLTVASAAAAHADELRVPSKRFRTLQAAADAAQPGDTIVVRGRVKGDTVISQDDVRIDASRAKFAGRLAVRGSGVVVEGMQAKKSSVVVTGNGFVLQDAELSKSDVTIRADGAVVQDVSISGIGPSRSFAIDAEGDGTYVSGALLRNVAGVHLVGNHSHLTDSTIAAPDAIVRVEGDDSSVQYNYIEAGLALLEVIGESAFVEGNGVNTGTFDDDFRPMEVVVSGDMAQVRMNDLPGGDVTLTGDDTVLTGNNLESVAVEGNRTTLEWNGATTFAVVGDQATVVSNNGSQFAIFTTDGTVSGNTAASPLGTAIRVEGTDTEISGNSAVCGNAPAAIVVCGCRQTITGNSATIQQVVVDGLGAATLSGDGIAVFGDENQVEANTVSSIVDGDTGVRVQGDQNVIDENVVTGILDGFGAVVSGDDNVVDDNQISDVQGEGLVVSGADNLVSSTDVANVSSCGFLLFTPTDLVDCSATNCQMGVVNLAPGTTVANSAFAGNLPYDFIDMGGAVFSGENGTGDVFTDRDEFGWLLGMQYEDTPVYTVDYESDLTGNVPLVEIEGMDIVFGD